MMSGSTDAKILCLLPISEALACSEIPECWDYGQIFYERSKEAESNGRKQEANAWHLLGQLAQVHMEASNVAEPFHPFAVLREGRTLHPSDMDQVTSEAVWELACLVDDPELRARLCDIVWDRLRKPEAAREAIKSYVESAKRLFDPDCWPPYAERMERALRLAVQIRDNELPEMVLSEMERRVIELNGDDPLYLTSELMERLHEFRKGDPDAMSAIARKAASAAEDVIDYWRARSHWQNLARWRRTAGDRDGERAANIAFSRTFELQAKFHAKEGDELLVAHFLEKAHEAYRNISGMRQKTADVYERLREAQQAAVNAMKSYQTDAMDISDSIRRAREHVSGKSKREALVALATVAGPTDFEAAGKHAQDMMARFPLQNVLGGSLLAHDGRVIGHRAPGAGGDEKQAQAALWERVVEQARLTYSLTAQALIIPAISQLMFEHKVSLRDLHELVAANPLVPAGREGLFARGTIAGLREDYEDALCMLVPQLENSLRTLLARSGVETTSRNKHGIQTPIPMGTILGQHQSDLQEILGVDVAKELKVLFGSEHGSDLRNRIAHGEMDHADFFSGETVYAWWFIYHLCMGPVVARFRAFPAQGSTGVPDAE